MFLAWLALTALFVVPLWRIFQRVGLAPGLTLFWIIPLLGPAIVVFILAFSRWSNGQPPTVGDAA